MNIAVLGGTFNPPHIGHLFLAEEVRCALGFDRIIFIPAHIPAHKAVSDGVASGDRLAMCKMAVKGHTAFQVDDCEIKRGGISYMIDTIDDLARRHPQAAFSVILGDDLTAGFRQWKDAAALARRVRLIVVHRRSKDRVSADFPHEYFDNKILPVSSSEIRERLREKLPVRFLIPEFVYEYIEKKRLYR